MNNIKHDDSLDIYDYIVAHIFTIFCKNEIRVDVDYDDEIVSNKKKFFNDYLFYFNFYTFINNEINEHDDFKDKIFLMYIIIIAIRDLLI